MTSLHSQRGDTLVEVIFALIILSAILVTTLSIGRLSRINNQNAQLRTQAINLVQEQYEALKSYRDNNPWQTFQGVGAGFVTPTGLNVDAGQSTPQGNCVTTAGDPSADTGCVFHMERDGRPGVTHGQWRPCPGTWQPPLDNDTGTPLGWDSAAPVAGEATDAYYINNYATLGCRGSARTKDAQPNISVGIYLHTPLSCGTTQPNAYNLTATGNWQQGGVKSQASTNLDFIMANIKGEPTC